MSDGDLCELKQANRSTSVAVEVRLPVNRDGDALRSLLHPDFVYTDTWGRRRGREEYVAFTTSAEGLWVDQSFEEVQVASEGSVVISRSELMRRSPEWLNAQECLPCMAPTGRCRRRTG